MPKDWFRTLVVPVVVIALLVKVLWAIPFLTSLAFLLLIVIFRLLTSPELVQGMKTLQGVILFWIDTIVAIVIAVVARGLVGLVVGIKLSDSLAIWRKVGGLREFINNPPAALLWEAILLMFLVGLVVRWIQGSIRHRVIAVGGVALVALTLWVGMPKTMGNFTPYLTDDFVDGVVKSLLSGSWGGSSAPTPSYSAPQPAARHHEGVAAPAPTPAPRLTGSEVVECGQQAEEVFRKSGAMGIRTLTVTFFGEKEGCSTSPIFLTDAAQTTWEHLDGRSIKMCLIYQDGGTDCFIDARGIRNGQSRGGQVTAYRFETIEAGKGVKMRFHI